MDKKVENRRNAVRKDRKGGRKNDYFGMKVLAALVIFLLSVSGLMLFFFKPVSEYVEFKEDFLQKSNSLNVGDIYSFSFQNDNPFEKSQTEYYRIIDKKRGYVQYVDTLTGDTMSMRVEMFLPYFKKVKGAGKGDSAEKRGE